MKLFEVDHVREKALLHPKFLLLKNNLQLEAERRILEEWSKGFVDKDKKFVKEFQDTFHSCFWELFLYELFSKSGAEIDQSHQVPDFVIKNPIEAYVEAVVSNISQYGRPEHERTIENQLSMTLPPYRQNDFYMFLNEAIIRNANALKTKNDKWKNEYAKKVWVDERNPYLIALQAYDQINYGREYIYSMFALLYGLYFDTKTEKYIKKEYIIKPTTNAKIELGIFETTEYENVSAVIFSCTTTLGKLTALSISEGEPSLNTVYNIRKNCEADKYVLQQVDRDSPEDLADGVFVFHNANAKVSLPEDFLRNVAVTHFYLENNQILISGNMTPIVARLNMPSLVEKYYRSTIVEHLRLYNRLPFDKFYEIE